MPIILIRMKKNIVVCMILAGCSNLFAQSIGNSPYAAFGVGEIKYDNTLDISSMGGVASAFVDDFGGVFNFTNPAANRNLNFTSFKIEGTGETNYFGSDKTNVKKNSSYLSNISLAFPVGEKWRFGIGYQPFSSRKYDIVQQTTLASGEKEVKSFQGKGSISTVQAAVGYNINENFSIGLRSNFYFGNLYNSEELGYSNADLINGYVSKNKYQLFNFTLGGVYQKTTADDHKMTIGANYSFGNIGIAEASYTNSTYFYLGEEKFNESIIKAETHKAKNSIPMTVGVGFGYGMDRKWFSGLQVTYKTASDMEYFGTPFRMNNSYRVAAGGWIMPNGNNFRNYFQRITYRGGAFFEKGGLNINKDGVINAGKDINSFGISLGASLPFQNTSPNRLSSLDFGIEFGQRGTTANGLIAQKFINLKVGLNFSDKWFQKKYYD